MNPLLKLHCTVRNLLNLSVTLLVMLSQRQPGKKSANQHGS